MIDFTVVLGATATPLIAAGLPPKYASWMVIADAAGHTVNMGGPTVTASRGVPITTSGSATGIFNFPRGCCLNNVYLFGTAADVIYVTYEPSE